MFWLVVLALIVVPVAELWVILQVADVIGGWQTIVLLIIEGIIGARLMKWQGRSVISRIDAKLRATELPTKDLADGFLILAAGLLMLTPGFLTDVVGFALLLPPTRALARIALLRRFSAKLGEGLSFGVVNMGSDGVRTARWGGDVMDTTATAERPSDGATPLGPGGPAR